MNGKTMSINREEILALTRRMTVKRTSMTRIAGCYADAEGFIDGTFNVNSVYLFHDRYDIPAKAKDKERLGESEQMFEYLICVISPVTGDYEPGKPECGFLFPAFFDGGAALNCVDVFQADSEHPHQELLQILFSEKS